MHKVPEANAYSGTSQNTFKLAAVVVVLSDQT